MKLAPVLAFVVFCASLISRPIQAQAVADSPGMISLGRSVDILKMIEAIVLYGSDCGDDFGVVVSNDVSGDFSLPNSFNLKNFLPRAALKKVAQLAGLHLAKIDDEWFLLSKKPLDANER